MLKKVLILIFTGWIIQCVTTRKIRITDECKCGKDQVIVGNCNQITKMITVTHYSFVRQPNGKCLKKVKRTYRPCLTCPSNHVKYGRCNFCTGKRRVTRYFYVVVRLKCVRRSNTRYENCQKCPKNIRKKRFCTANKYLRTTVYFNRLVGCFRCVSDQKTSTKEIKCKTRKVVKRINKTTECKTIYKRTLSNCKCRTRIIRKCCSLKCPRSKTRKYCRNGKFIFRTLSYKFTRICIPKISHRTKVPRCPKNTVTKLCIPRQGTVRIVHKIYRVNKKSCRCYASFRTRYKQIRCPKNTVTKLCIPRQGTVRIVHKIYRVNKKACRCYASIRTRYRQTRCLIRPRNIIRRAAHVYHNGIYDSITTIFYRRHNCACLRRTSTRFVLNRCRHNYQRSRSHHRLYNYICKKRFQIPKPVPIPWRPPHKPVRPPHRPWRPPHRPWRPPHRPWRPPHRPVRPPHRPWRPPHRPWRPPHRPVRRPHRPWRPTYTPWRPYYRPWRQPYRYHRRWF